MTKKPFNNMSLEDLPGFVDDDAIPEWVEQFQLDQEMDRRAALSNEEWWEENYADVQRGKLSRALAAIVNAGIAREPLLGKLRNIEELSEGYAYDRRNLGQLAARLSADARDLERFQTSWLYQMAMPVDAVINAMRLCADDLRSVHENTRKDEFPQRTKAIARVRADLRRVKEWGRKGRVDAAIALLLQAITGKKHTAAAERQARWRWNKTRGLPGRRKKPAPKKRGMKWVLKKPARPLEALAAPLEGYRPGVNSVEDALIARLDGEEDD